MDTGKILKVVNDIQSDEANFGFQTKFQSILNFYNEQNPDALNSERLNLRNDLDKSNLFNYVLTDIKILEYLQINVFFGEQSWVELNNILENQAHEVKQKLQNFVQLRQDSLNKIASLKSSLDSFEVKPKDLAKNEYEIGFSFPEDYQYLSKLPEVLIDIRNLLMAVANGTSVANKNFKIKSVSNGSVQFYIEAAKELAKNFDIVLDYALKIYAFVQMMKELKDRYETMKIKKQTEIEEINKQEVKDKKEEYIESMLSDLKIIAPDDQNRIRGLFGKLLKHFEMGVSAEVRTPNLEVPKDPTENDDDATKKKLLQAKKEYDFKKEIDQRNKNIFVLQQNNFYGIDMKLLELPDIGDEEK